MSRGTKLIVVALTGKNRGIEWVKSILIVVLFCTAAYLSVQTGIYSNWSQWGILEKFFGQGTVLAQPDATATEWTEASYPIAMAVVGEDGRYGVQYSQETTEVYQTFRSLIGEGLVSGTNLQPIDELEWQRALQQNGVLCTYLGGIPLATLSAWMNDSQGSEALTGVASRLLLAQGEGDSVVLYYYDETDGGYYMLETAISYNGHMDGLLSNYKGNGATFAFEYEAEAGYEALDPYVMVLGTTLSPIVYASANPLDLEDEGLMSQIQEVLGFYPQTSTQYTVPEELVVRENDDVLRLTEDGILTYVGEDTDYIRFLVEGSGVTAAVERCQAIVSATIAPLCGDGAVMLSDVFVSEDTYTITFSYVLEGIEVQFFDGSWGAQFQVEGGVVTQFTLNFRNYTATEETSMVLRETQAAAAMGALDVDKDYLVLCYEDWGDTALVAGWVAE